MPTQWPPYLALLDDVLVLVRGGAQRVGDACALVRLEARQEGHAREEGLVPARVQTTRENKIKKSSDLREGPVWTREDLGAGKPSPMLRKKYRKDAGNMSIAGTHLARCLMVADSRMWG